MRLACTVAMSGDDWSVRRYFVDEAGDTTLFNRHGTPLVGRDGSSRYFIIGVAEVDDEPGLARKFSELRGDICSDPATKELPSLQHARGKTAAYFHAKDDHRLVRSRVFDLLSRHSFRFYAVIRDKEAVLTDLLATQRLVPEYRYSQSALYDSMVGRLFRDRLHADDCEIVFAKRGKKPRTAALRSAIEDAKSRFRERWNLTVDRTPAVEAASPMEHAGLQAVDYSLWALQRWITRGEKDDWQRISSKAVELISLDQSMTRDGEVYTPSRPLTRWDGASGV